MFINVFETRHLLVKGSVVMNNIMLLSFVLVFISIVTSSGIPSAFQNKIYSCSVRLNNLEAFKCHIGSHCVNIKHVCDGIIDCPDGSDESICSHYGIRNYLQSEDRILHRVKRQFNCGQNQVQCPDGSCESHSNDCGIGEACTLPAYPDHGTYQVLGAPYAQPRQVVKYFLLTVSCDAGYGVVKSENGVYRNGSQEILCIKGKWRPQEMPKCVPFCTLNPDPSVVYACRLPKTNTFRICERTVPTGTVVSPQCNVPVYYSHKSLPYMNCRNGMWDYSAKCEPDCGRVTPEALQLISNGSLAKRGELPWHVGIYVKTSRAHQQICGGSLVSNNAVISAAHCFWHDVHLKQPASKFAVAVGKLHQSWQSELDKESQESDVKDILIPEQFQGSGSTLQADVAVLLLVTPFVYKSHIKPICLNFDKEFERQQLQKGKNGKVAGWGLTAANGPGAKELNVVEMPYIGYQQCVSTVPQSFKQFITLDKFCAGHTDGTAVCRGDSGGGLAFPALDQFIERYYLRGIVSAAPRSDHQECNVDTYATFTRLSIYDEFIKDAMQGRFISWAPAIITREDETSKRPLTIAGKPVVPLGSADCGLPAPVNPEDSQYVPWHVAIYTKTTTPYKLICGGSLVTNNVLISAASCFWSDVLKKLPSSDFAAGIGKLHRSWDSPNDTNAQYSDVKDIYIPASFQGGLTRFQDDISIVRLATPFTYTRFVKPICLDVDTSFDRLHLQPGKYGKVASWGAIAPTGSGSEILKVIEMPFINKDTCVSSLPPTFVDYFTTDKFCAGYTNGTALCPNDGGGGLVFTQRERGRNRFYLRGIVSAAASNEDKCNVNTYMLFTQITAHEQFIREYIYLY